MKILITGGASGLGAAITKELAKYPSNFVYFTYNSSAAASKLIEEEFNNTKGIKCDFTSKDDLEELLLKVKELDLSVLINNAYIGPIDSQYFHKIQNNNFQTNFEKNILPTLSLTQEVIKYFRKKKTGKIITILTSYLYNTPPIGMAVYTGNKAYLKQQTKVWAMENIKFKITSNSISPSIMQTDLTKDVDERILEQMTSAHPLKTLLTVQEVAHAVHFLTEASNHINGVDIPLNAGVNIK